MNPQAKRLSPPGSATRNTSLFSDAATVKGSVRVAQEFDVVVHVQTAEVVQDLELHQVPDRREDVLAGTCRGTAAPCESCCKIDNGKFCRVMCSAHGKRLPTGLVQGSWLR